MTTISVSAQFEIGTKVRSAIDAEKVGQVTGFFVAGVSPRRVRYGVTWLAEDKFVESWHDDYELQAQAT